MKTIVKILDVIAAIAYTLSALSSVWVIGNIIFFMNGKPFNWMGAWSVLICFIACILLLIAKSIINMKIEGKTNCKNTSISEDELDRIIAEQNKKINKK